MKEKISILHLEWEGERSEVGICCDLELALQKSPDPFTSGFHPYTSPNTTANSSPALLAVLVTLLILKQE